MSAQPIRHIIYSHSNQGSVTLKFRRSNRERVGFYDCVGNDSIRRLSIWMATHPHSLFARLAIYPTITIYPTS